MIDNLYSIEFVKGEPVCRFNGELATDKWYENKCGIFGEVEIDENFIVYEDTIYVKGKIDFYSLLMRFGTFKKARDYDYIANKGYGSVQAYTEQRIYGQNGSIIISNPERFKDMKLKPYSKFMKDYPNFNEKEYNKIQESLDYYYEQRR